MVASAVAMTVASLLMEDIPLPDATPNTQQMPRDEEANTDSQ